MKKKGYFGILLLLLAIFATACKLTSPPKLEGEEIHKPEEDETVENKDLIKKQEEKYQEDEEKEIDRIQEKLDRMTLEEKIGQLFIFGFKDQEVNEEAIQLIEENHIGGFILFSRNVLGGEQTMDLLNGLKERNKNNPLPLFLSIDEEGGRVSRLPEEYPAIPAPKKIGDLDKEEVAFQYGKVLAMRLNTMGFNMNFAPVLDVNSNPKNPVIGDRAFGSNQDLVAAYGLEAMEGIKSKGVIPVAKHFPGHGDTSVDSHIDIPRVDKSLEEMKEVELVPFVQAVENGGDIIMVGHILFPQLDEEYPASLSNEIINGLLRDEMGFDGLVITDDLNMGAIMENYNISEAIIRYFKSGGDIALVCHGEEEEFNIFQTLKEEVAKGNISEAEIDEKVYRIIRVKDKYNLQDTLRKEFTMEELEEEMEDFLNKFN